jgi:hypothetical protein
VPRLSRFKYNLTGLFVSWGLAVGAGVLLLEAYAARPGQAGTPAERWPEGSPIRLDRHRPTLLIFLHPRCPCSRASLAELATLMACCRDRVSAHALLFQPAQLPAFWGWCGIEQDLAGLPDVSTRPDVEGVEARRFGVATSGHVLLYDSDARLIFSGGITAARGHQGGNYGRDAVVAQVLGRESARPKNPVFGCLLPTPQPSLSQECRR